MNSIPRRYILRYEEEHNQLDARDNEPTIKFTHEVEDNETLCFLDTQIKRVDKKTHIQHLLQTYGHFSSPTTASNTNQQPSTS
jgi:hypothetical protein